jgi:hypothetical protein
LPLRKSLELLYNGINLMAAKESQLGGESMIKAWA